MSSRARFEPDAKLVRALDQPIPEPPRRLDQHLADLGLLELLAQSPHVDIHESSIASGLVAPNADEQIVAREHASRLASERAKQLELCRRQRELLVPGDRLHAGEIHDEAPEAQLSVLRVVVVNAIPAEQRLDARGELVVVKWLAQIAVGAD